MFGNPTISTKLIASKLKEEGTVVSRVTVGRHLAEHSYKNSLPLTTPMLIKAHKEIRVTWAKNKFGNGQFSLTKHHFNCFEIQLNIGIKVQGQYARCRKINVKL